MSIKLDKIASGREGPHTSEDKGLDENYGVEKLDQELEKETHPEEHRSEEGKVDSDLYVVILEEHP